MSADIWHRMGSNVEAERAMLYFRIFLIPGVSDVDFYVLDLTPMPFCVFRCGLKALLQRRATVSRSSHSPL